MSRVVLLAALVAVASMISGCASSAPCGTTAKFPTNDGGTLRIVHALDPSKSCDDHFVVAPDAPLAHLNATLENYYKSRCPGPIGTVDVIAPNGTTFAHLESQQLPTFDCVYSIARDEKLAPGEWTLRYSGGSINEQSGVAWLASLLIIDS